MANADVNIDQLVSKVTKKLTNLQEQMQLLYQSQFNVIEVKLMALTPDYIWPRIATPGSACFDLFIPFDFRLYPRVISKTVGTVIDLGFAVEIPPGFEMQIRSRGGLSKRGVVVVNSPGTVDSDYRGELKVLLTNHSTVPVDFKRGDAIAQAVVKPVPMVRFKEVTRLTPTKRGAGCLGSTDVQTSFLKEASN